MAMGVLEDATWEQKTIHLAAGDLLVLYTDGVTDADNRQGGFFGEERLLEAVLDHCDYSAQEIQDALVAEVHKFVGDAPQFDDITLMVIKREK
jgi:sigma-B regulation protein RsbU (phosphoserine phosphatase)